MQSLALYIIHLLLDFPPREKKEKKPTDSFSFSFIFPVKKMKKFDDEFKKSIFLDILVECQGLLSKLAAGFLALSRGLPRVELWLVSLLWKKKYFR